MTFEPVDDDLGARIEPRLPLAELHAAGKVDLPLKGGPRAAGVQETAAGWAPNTPPPPPEESGAPRQPGHGLRPTAVQTLMSERAGISVPGSGRHSLAGTTPGSISSRPSKRAANSSRGRVQTSDLPCSISWR